MIQIQLHNNPEGISSKNFQQFEDIQDNALDVLRSICSGNDLASQAKKDIMMNPEYREFLLDKLKQMNMVLRLKTLRVLYLIVTDEQNLHHFRTLLPTSISGSKLLKRPVTFITQIVQILHDTMINIPTHPTMVMVELVKYCLNILRLLCKDTTLLRNIFDELQEFSVIVEPEPTILTLPQYAIRFIDFAPSALGLLAELAKIHESFSSWPEYMDLQSLNVSQLDDFQLEPFSHI